MIAPLDKSPPEPLDTRRMTALDILTLLLMGGAGLLGFQRGFVTESLSLVAWVVALVAVKIFHAPATAILEGTVGTWGGGAVLAFALVFGITFMIGKMIARSIGDKSKKSFIGGFDRVLGLGFGAVKGLIGATLIYTVAALVNDTVYGGGSDRPGWMTESRTYPLLDASSRALVDFIGERRKAGKASAEGE